MKFKLSTYLFAFGAMAGLFAAINETAMADEERAYAAARIHHVSPAVNTEVSTN